MTKVFIDSVLGKKIGAPSVISLFKIMNDTAQKTTMHIFYNCNGDTNAFVVSSYNTNKCCSLKEEDLQVYLSWSSQHIYAVFEYS